MAKPAGSRTWNRRIAAWAEYCAFWQRRGRTLLLEFLQRVRTGVGVEQHRRTVVRAFCQKAEDVGTLIRVDRLRCENLPGRRQLHQCVSAFGVGDDKVAVRQQRLRHRRVEWRAAVNERRAGELRVRALELLAARLDDDLVLLE